MIRRLAIHPVSGEVVVAGHTLSANLPCTTAGGGCSTGAQSAHAADTGNFDNFVARFSPDLTLADATPVRFVFGPVNGAPVSTLTTSAPVQVNGLFGPVPVYVDGALGSAYCLSSGNNCACNASGGFVTAAGTITTGSLCACGTCRRR
ncbi:MAG: hypothetical protein ABI831_26710 [Betaproteobacteria bacterium]